MIQEMSDAMKAIEALCNQEVHQEAVAVNQMTLGEFIATLKLFHPAKLVRLDYDKDRYPGQEMSYRGYYEQLAFAPRMEPASVCEVLARAQTALGGEYEGYKGGSYRMNRATWIWIAPYGDCGVRIVDVVDLGSCVMIKTVNEK